MKFITAAVMVAGVILSGSAEGCEAQDNGGDKSSKAAKVVIVKDGAVKVGKGQKIKAAMRIKAPYPSNSCEWIQWGIHKVNGKQNGDKYVVEEGDKNDTSTVIAKETRQFETRGCGQWIKPVG